MTQTIRSTMLVNGTSVEIETTDPSLLVSAINSMTSNKVTRQYSAPAQAASSSEPRRKNFKWTEDDIIRLARFITSYGLNSRGLPRAGYTYLKNNGDIKTRNYDNVAVLVRRVAAYLKTGNTFGLHKSFLGALNRNGFGPRGSIIEA